MPAEAFVVGEPVTVMTIDYDGNERRGLTARCRREEGSEQVIAACDLIFPEGSVAARYMAAYRTWLGIEPHPSLSITGLRPQKATEDDFDMTRQVELIAVAVKGNTVSCRIPGKQRLITIRPAGLWDVALGEIIIVRPRKQWRYRRHPYLSGEIKTWRLDVAALGLTPLKLKERGMWDPKDHYWGEPDEPIEEWAKPLMSRGPRPEYEMEQVLPGQNPDDPDTDPILEAAERREAGDYLGAHRMVMTLLAADLRCLDLHAHLGNFVFDHSARGRFGMTATFVTRNTKDQLAVPERTGRLCNSTGTRAKPPEKGTEWGTVESCPTLPSYGGDMESNHYDLRTALKKGNELS